MQDLSKKKILKLFAESKSKSEVITKLGLCRNSWGYSKVSQLIEEHQIDISHFDKGASKNVLYPREEKECPVCEKTFIVKKGHPREKTVCSRSCSNTFFRSNENNGNYKHGLDSIYNGHDRIYRKEYKKICFDHYEHKCLLCDWTLCLDVHHIDGNHSNNDISNLVPLCANHHRLTTTVQHRDEIGNQIDQLKKY